MSLFDEISAARRILAIPETATLATIKANYRKLLLRWHPDTCEEDKDVCAEMTRKIVSAYRTIQDYCAGYQYSFSESAVRRHLSPEEWWFDRFGHDPLWGSGDPPNGMSGRRNGRDG